MTRRGLIIEAASREILTRAVGFRNQPDFHNQVLRVRTAQPWTAHQWLAVCQASEREAGRRPTFRWGPRVADADILLLGRDGAVSVRDSDLTVPHAQLRNRPFLALLLAEVKAPASG